MSIPDYNEIAPQDLGSGKSVLDFLLKWAVATQNRTMQTEVTLMIQKYKDVFEVQSDDLTRLPYNRRDYYNILEWLKLQAESLSKGRWTDFSEAEIGTVYLKLMSYLADMQNYQLDKTACELYMSTCTEKATALMLCSLIGYEPRHFMSAKSVIHLEAYEGETIPDGTVFPKGSTFVDANGAYKYTSLKDAKFANNKCDVEAYEGTLKTVTFSLADITPTGKILLPDYQFSYNTTSLVIDGNIEYKRVENAVANMNELVFSIHTHQDGYNYIQLPTFWADALIQTTEIKVSYLLTQGFSGRIGKNILVNFGETTSSLLSSVMITGNDISEGGYDPETVDEIKISAPIYARTMEALVTLPDYNDLLPLFEGVADCRALDYNYPDTGLVQPSEKTGPNGGGPNDAFKLHLYILPEINLEYDATKPETYKYRNTIVKAREDWTVEDLGKTADDLLVFKQSDIVNNQVKITGAHSLYELEEDVIAVINTLDESTYKFIDYVSDVSGITDRPAYSLKVSGDDWIITLNSNWKDFFEEDWRLNVYLKREQILTSTGQALREYVDSRRIADLQVFYKDVKVINPVINIDLYMDKYNANFDTAVADATKLIYDLYSRPKFKIGQSIFASVIGQQIHDNLPYVRYCEVGLPEFTDDKLEANYIQFYDFIPNKLDEEGNIVPLITIRVFDYQLRGGV